MNAQHGGALAEDMQLTLSDAFRPTYPRDDESWAGRAQEAEDLMAMIARHYLNHAIGLTLKQKQLLRDIEKGRYKFTVFSHLLDIAPLAPGGGAFALSEAFRGQTLRRRPQANLCVVNAWVEEAIRQGAADVEHNRFILERTSVRRDSAIEYLVPHWDALRTAIDSLHTWQPNGRRVFG